MSPYLRKVKTRSGATAVQIVEKRHGQRVIVEHLGSAHTDAELAALMRAGHDKLHAGQPAFELGIDPHGVPVGAVAVVAGTRSKLLMDAIRASWGRLGFTVIDDEAFFQLVAARLVEPTSKRDSIRVINQLGMHAFHENTYYAALGRCVAGDYREQIAKACFTHVWTDAGGDISLLLYDVTVRHEALVVRVGVRDLHLIPCRGRGLKLGAA